MPRVRGWFSFQFNDLILIYPYPRAKAGDAGADLIANEDVTLSPGGGRALIGTGIAIAIPPGYAGFVQPRSGIALRHGITCLNTPGLIDSGYRDELKVLLINTDPNEPYEVQRGDRIAQLVIQKLKKLWEEKSTNSMMKPNVD